MITTETVKHIAKLAKLELSQDEEKLFQKQLGSILDFIDKLNEADTSGVDIMSSVQGSKNIMREDVSCEFPDKEALLSNVPDREYDFVKVKKVIE